MDYTDYNSVIKSVEDAEQFRADVITLANTLRSGLVEFRVSPVSNGFLVAVGHEVFIAKNHSEVGLLSKTLWSSDLENEKVLKRLRRMTGRR